MADDRAPADVTSPGERDLAVLLRGMDPVVRPGVFAVATVDGYAALAGVAPKATVHEDEGLTVVVAVETARALQLDVAFEAAWITLRIHSALDAVGLTAAFSEALAQAGISCNVLAGRFHDHLLVPVDRRDEALAALRALARGG